ncbi:MAG: Eco57I restriction-modification methylase domain-containing protein [Candidatus Hermodarchaeota archaeon]
MKEFIDFLKNEGIIQRLKDIYKLDHRNSKESEFIDAIIEIFVHLDIIKDFGYNSNQEEVMEMDMGIDIIGKIYESKISNIKKKKLGEFYTPSHVVKYILDAIGYGRNHGIEDKKIVDLSCGCGSFLIQIVKIIMNFYFNKFNLRNLDDISIDQARVIIKKIQENVFGFDINPITCVLCCINLYFSFYELLKIINMRDDSFEIPVLNIINANILEYSNFDRFDFVVGNPPYLFLRNISPENKLLIEQGNFKTIKGQYDYYQIFIELGINVLKEKGFLGYIIPDSLLALSNRKLIRKFIFNNTKIRELYYIGPSFEIPIVANVIIILQKECEEDERFKNLITIHNPLINTGLYISVKQSTLKEWDYKFLVNLNEEDIKILKYLNSNFPKIDNIMKNPEYKIRIFRGVELGKEGKIVYCKKCNRYIAFPRNNTLCKVCNSLLDLNFVEKIVIDNIPKGSEDYYKRFLFLMNRYQVKRYKYINIKKRGINYKNIEDYKDRIVIRQLNQNNLICATYDKESLTSQSFYNLKIIKSPIPEFNHFYLLGLLNSQLLSYYFIKIFGSYKKLFPRILIEKIKNLPIKLPKSANELLISKHIQEKVRKILLLNDLSKKEIDKLQNDIDSLVFNIYQISIKNRLYISKFLRNL